MAELVQPVSADRCPLCGAGNACAMATADAADKPCWCVAASFSDDLLARVPPEARGKACICASCAAAAAEDGQGRRP